LRRAVAETCGRVGEDVRQRLTRIVLGKRRWVHFGSGNEAFQELTARFGSARAACDPVIAIEFAHDPDDPVDRRKALGRHCAVADDERLVQSAHLRRDECAGRLGRTPGEEVANIFA
jgi:hypothetical protein